MKRVSGLLTLCAMFGFMMAGCSVETSTENGGGEAGGTVDHGAMGAPMHGDADHSHDAEGGEAGGDAPAGDEGAGDTPAGEDAGGEAPTSDDATPEENTTPE